MKKAIKNIIRANRFRYSTGTLFDKVWMITFPLFIIGIICLPLDMDSHSLIQELNNSAGFVSLLLVVLFYYYISNVKVVKDFFNYKGIELTDDMTLEDMIKSTKDETI